MDPLETVLRRAIDPQLGIVRALIEQPLQAADAGAFTFGAQFTSSALLVRAEGSPAPPSGGRLDSGHWSTATETDKRRAVWATLGEAFERYAAASFGIAEFKLASFSELGPTAMDPSRFIRFSDEQYARQGFPFARFASDLKHYWVDGAWLDGTGAVQVPAAAVYLNCPSPDPKSVIDLHYSTGLAAGASMTQVALSGLCEVIERDAFMFTWLVRRRPPRLFNAQVAPFLPTGPRRHFEAGLLELYVFDLTTDIGVPVILAALRDHAHRTFSLGAASHPNAVESVRKAVLEACSTQGWLHQLLIFDRQPCARAEDVRTFEDHVSFYMAPERHRCLEFLLGAQESLALQELRDAAPALPGDMAGQLLIVIERTVAAGFRPALVDLTTRDLADLGVHAGRVVVPGLHPLHAGMQARHEDTRRLRALTTHFTVQMPEELNPDPHPFP